MVFLELRRQQCPPSLLAKPAGRIAQTAQPVYCEQWTVDSTKPEGWSINLSALVEQHVAKCTAASTNGLVNGTGPQWDGFACVSVSVHVPHTVDLGSE